MTQSLTAVNQTLQVWGTRDDVRELTERLQLMLPGGKNLNPNDVRALAQGAVAHGLDPLNGEIWMIPGRGLMIGVKGLRKKAREQVQGNFWIEFREIDNAEERKRYGIVDGALAFEARLFDSENIRTYTEAVGMMTKAGIPWEAVKDMIGSKPYTSGVGVLKPTEQTRMERVQCAMKRAEADAIKRRFDVPFGLQQGIEEDDTPTYSGEWADADGATGEPIDPKEMYHQLALELKATDQEIGQAMEDAGGDYETAAQMLNKRVASRKLQANKKQLGRDDSGL
jgi:hypothetical protein